MRDIRDNNHCQSTASLSREPLHASVCGQKRLFFRVCDVDVNQIFIKFQVLGFRIRAQIIYRQRRCKHFLIYVQIYVHRVRK